MVNNTDKPSSPAVGVVAGDQFMSPDVGDVLLIERLGFPVHKVAADGQDWTSFKGVVLLLQFGNTKRMRIMGSAVMVAPGIAIAARHVVEPEIPALMATETPEPVGFLASAITPNGVDIWRVHQVVWEGATDAVILILIRFSAFSGPPKITQAILSTRLPPIGEPVSICGFVASAPEFDSSERMGGRIHISQGLVAEHFLRGRDRVMLPGPCFSVSVGTPGGLSGGPAFDKNGRLVGILSSSFGDSEDDISFVSLLYPLLAHPVQPVWPPAVIKSPTPLLHFDGRLCEIEGRDRVEIPDQSGRSLRYDAWS